MFKFWGDLSSPKVTVYFHTLLKRPHALLPGELRKSNVTTLTWLNNLLLRYFKFHLYNLFLTGLEGLEKYDFWKPGLCITNLLAHAFPFPNTCVLDCVISGHFLYFFLLQFSPKALTLRKSSKSFKQKRVGPKRD